MMKFLLLIFWSKLVYSGVSTGRQLEQWLSIMEGLEEETGTIQAETRTVPGRSSDYLTFTHVTSIVVTITHVTIR